jgi:hypothetical protein
MATVRDDDAQPRGRSWRVPGAGAMGLALRPLRRTGRYYSRARRDYRDSSIPGLPPTPPTAALAVQAFRDQVVLVGLGLRRPVSDPKSFERITREVVAAQKLYEHRGWLEHPQRFFTAPPALSDATLIPVRRRLRSYQRITFDSGYSPHSGEPGRQRWLGYPGTKRGYALLLRHPEPAPWLICVHGTEMGRGAVDLALFRAWHLHEDLGLNVLLPVLPMHGPRARGLPPGAVFPGEDALDDVHAAAQAVWDIRRLLSWVRHQEPDSPIGLNGMSLGAYIAALVASLESGLTCAILGVPVADLVVLLARHSGLGRDDPRRHTMTLAEPLGRMISPLSLPPRIPHRGRFIYAGIADQVVDPREQTIPLWEHWDQPEILWYRGGHTGFIRSRRIARFIDAALVQSALVGPRERRARRSAG